MRELERMSGVSKETLSGIERGSRAPQALTLGKLANALEVDIEDLLGESPKAPSRSPLERTLEDALEEERRAEELGRAWVQQVSKIRQHREELLQRRLDEATTEDERNRAGLEFYAAWLHTHVLIGEAVELHQATEVPELRAAMHAWREKAMQFHAPLLWPAEVGEMLKDLEAQMPAEEAGAQAPHRD